MTLSKDDDDLVARFADLLVERKLAPSVAAARPHAFLMWALDCGIPAQIEQGLADGADPNFVFPRGDTPLGRAIHRPDRMMVVPLLLRAGANPNQTSEGKSPAAIAAERGNVEVLELLVDSAPPADLGPMLLTAAVAGPLPLCQRLMGRGAPVNYAGYYSAFYPDRVRPLMLATSFGRVDVVQLLLSAGADPALKDADGHTALNYARVEPNRDKAKVATLLERLKAPAGRPFADPAAATRGFLKASKQPGYQAFVARLKSLTRVSPKPLESADDKIPGGGAFLLPESDARALVAEHRDAALAAGGTLFFTRDLSTTNGPAAALLPTTDVYRVLAAVGTEGANSNVYTDDLIAFLRDLEKTHPFTLTAIGADFVEGTFDSPIKDPAALAARLNKICPDGIPAPPADAREQADRLAESRRLYLWWD